MKLSVRWSVVFIGLCGLGFLPVPAAPANEGKSAEQVDMVELMKRAKKFTGPSDYHKLLERFIGTWDTELRVTGSGGSSEKGVASFEWLMQDRWIVQKSSGSMMGMPLQSFSIMGYDNFKMSYVTASVNSLDTALLTSEGDMDPVANVLITYGTLDEYLTGEHDKMVKYVWRFKSENEMTLEVHDLPIGERNTKVMEVSYRRRAATS